MLDCGCGRGGDLHKWNSVGAFVLGVDPDLASIEEARRRASAMHISRVKFDVGDIFIGKIYGPFDVICYNFSIHYIAPTLKESVEAIVSALKPGGLLIGITPDRERIRTFVSPDALGNTVDVIDDTTVSVRLVDGPFYAQGGRREPMIGRRELEHALAPWCTCVEWSPMITPSNGYVSDVYSTFIFRRY